MLPVKATVVAMDSRLHPTAAELDAEFEAQVRLAIEGDLCAQSWLIEQLTPVLLATAQRYHKGHLRALMDPEDIVQDVWVKLFGHLESIVESDGGLRSSVRRYMTTSIANRYRDLATRLVQNRPLKIGSDVMDSELSAQTSGIVTKATRAETAQMLQQALDQLDALDRTIVILRGVEQLPAKQVAVIAGTTTDVVFKRYSRALNKLRLKLPAAQIGWLEVEDSTLSRPQVVR